MIVKIQRPLMTNGNATPMALVYNRGRKFTAQIPYTSDIEALFSDGSLKVYHEVKEKRGKLLIGDRVENQDF